MAPPAINEHHIYVFMHGGVLTLSFIVFLLKQFNKLAVKLFPENLSEQIPQAFSHSMKRHTKLTKSDISVSLTLNFAGTTAECQGKL
jgi:hypothetical protein